MTTYRKKAPRTKKQPQKKAPAKKPSTLTFLTLKLNKAFAPLNKFQKALTYQGDLKKKPNAAIRVFKKHASLISWAEKILVAVFFIYALFTNAYLLLLLPATGFLVLYRSRLNWLWWKVKVFILYRDFYEHRRSLYKQGSLFHHLAYKQPKRYSNAIIWGESESVQNIKFKKLQKANTLTAKEYITL